MATYKQRTTPGVFITELDAFPRSVAGVKTAIPIFIGYTEKAELSGKPIYYKPTKINSLAGYEELFGTGFSPTFNIFEVPQSDAQLFKGTRVLEPGEDAEAKDNYDFSCLRNTSTTSVPEWTLKYYRFTRAEGVVGDTLNSGAILGQSIDPLSITTLADFNLYNALRLFYANGGGTCYVVSVGPYYDDDGQAVTVSFDALEKGLHAAGEQSGPTMTLIPDAVLLKPEVNEGNPPFNKQFFTLCKQMIEQGAAKQDRVAILDVYGANWLDQQRPGWELQMDALIQQFQENIGERELKYGMAYFPFLVTSIIPPGELNYTNLNIEDPTQWNLIQGILDDQAELNYVGAKLTTVLGYISDMNSTVTDPDDTAEVDRLNQNLVNAIPLLKEMENIMTLKTSLMPTSAAMAGVYTYTDGTRGVWNAPANVTLNSVITPNVTLNNAQQGNLNVPLDGKAINVIRQFVGRGPVVWGARTLDGNSQDWRYIQIRRTLIYIEQSIEAALQPFVFAANDGKTWVAVASMVTNFLQGLWSQGGLMGAKADEAFTVECGLGSTMTPQDILDGYMIVNVTLQMIRPAEYIEITFKQKMQGLG